MSNKLTQAEVSKRFAAKNLELLTIYKDSKQSLEFKCHCGKIGVVSNLSNLKRVNGCKVCSGSRLSQEIVRERFEAKGLELLSEYEHHTKKLKYRCHCGNTSSTLLEDLKDLKGCGCSQHAPVTFEEVQRRFIAKGFVLLSTEYEHHTKKLDYICHCGNTSSTTLGDLRRLKGCGVCANNKPLLYEDVKARFEAKGFVLISEEYTGVNEKLQYICKCGELGSTNVTNLNALKGCAACRCEDRPSFDIEEDVRPRFTERGYTLLSTEYVDAKSPLKYICTCGAVCETSLANLTSNISISCISCSEERRKKRCQEKYGTDHPFANAEVIEKRKKTLFKNFGVEHPAQNREIYRKIQKSAYEKKEYTFPSGKTTMIQGYEHFALNMLLERYPEEVIETDYEGEVPSIPYILDGNTHIYFPDISIAGTNRLIEVKSEHTWNRDERKNMAKMHACAAQGYKIECWFFDAKGNRIAKKKAKIVKCDKNLPIAENEMMHENGVRTLIPICYILRFEN